MFSDIATASQPQLALKLKLMTIAAVAANAAGADADTANRVESAVATEVCGLSKNHQWKPETVE